MNILEKIVTVGFPPDQYYREFTDKSQIDFHHTVSGKGVEGDIAWWLSSKSRIATALIIDREGIPWQCFSSRFWAHHLGVTKAMFKKYGVVNTNEALNKASIGIELDSWGPLMRTGSGKWYSVRKGKKKGQFVPNTFTPPVKESNIQFYPDGFRGFEAFEKYTPAQLDTAGELCQYWNKVYGITMAYNSDQWDVSVRALRGAAGIWNHVSFREDKSDCHPDPNLIKLLKNL